MSELSELFDEVSCGQIVSIKMMMDSGLDTVTITGYEEVATKKGLQPVFKIAENNLKFWASGKVLRGAVDRLSAKYKTAAAINAALKAKPQTVRFYETITLANGNKFRPVEFLGDAEEDED